MAKGRTNRPLVIFVAPEWTEHPEIVKLREAGHTIESHSLAHPDLILHPAAHKWDEHMWDYLPAALRMARAEKRGR